MNGDDKILVTQSSMPPFEEYVEAIRPLWESRWLTNMGACHQELERELRQFLGVQNLSLTVNGHMALELAIQSFGFPEGSEIITTPFTFISTTHAIVRNRLVPVFCDVRPEDGTMDDRKLEGLITEKTAAILPVHVYGNVCRVEQIQQIADKYGIKVIYDAAHAFGEKYKGEGIGNFGDVSIFSFHATKVFHTIEGGAVASKDKKINEALYNLKNFGIHGEESVEAVGANAKMNEFCAAMGLCNLKHFAKSVAERKKAFYKYRECLSGMEHIHFLEKKKEVDSNYAYCPILVEDRFSGGRDGLYEKLRGQGIYPRKYFYPLTPDQECYRGMFSEDGLAEAREMARKILVLPLYEGLGQDTIEKICALVRKWEG